jgi:hypothetical protein
MMQAAILDAPQLPFRLASIPRLKRLLADAMLGNAALKDLLGKKW